MEACLWTEVVATSEQVDGRLWPRLAATAEVAWTPQRMRKWDDFARRVAQFETRWNADGLDYTKDPSIPW